ncbi:MAG: hypothetical protein RIS70_114 [Planctomycetota bacterium]|jgi:hypothetical protein
MIMRSLNNPEPSYTVLYYQAWRIILIATIALWLGGLTFYSVFVVPIGNERLGSIGQGLLTAIITRQLNAIGNIAFACIFIDAVLRRRRRQLAGAIILALSQIGLYAVHDQLFSHIDFESGSLLPHSDGWSFYATHRLYLILTSLQWLIGLAIFCRLITASAAEQATSRPD